MSVRTAISGRDSWTAHRWWVFLVVPQLCLGLFFLALPLLRGDAHYVTRSPSEPYGFGWLLLIFFVPYGLGLSAMRRTGSFPSRRGLRIAFAVSAVPLMLAPLAQSHDAYQYLFYAKMQLAHGANPYVTVPSTFASDPWFNYIGWPEQVSVYGPLWTMLVAGATAVTGQQLAVSLLGLKVLATGATAAATWGLASVKPDHTSGVEPNGTYAAVAFALNPLVLTAGPSSAHPDVFLAAFFAWAIVLDQRRRPILAGLLLVVAVLFKAYAVFPLAIYCFVLWRRGDLRPRQWLVAAGAAAAVVAVSFAPYWAGWQTLAGTFSIAKLSSSGLGGRLQVWVEGLARFVHLGSAATVASITSRTISVVILVLVTVWIARNTRTLREPWWAAGILLASFLLVTPWYLPWYVVGLLALTTPLVDRTIRAPVLLFSGTQLVQVPGLVDAPQTLLRYGMPLLYWLRLRSERAHPPSGRPDPPLDAGAAATGA